MDNSNRTYAGFWVRWLAEGVEVALNLDIFLFGLYLFVTLSGQTLETFFAGLLYLIAGLLSIGPIINLGLHPWLVKSFGAGIGKLACGLEIIREDGSRLTFKNALFRDRIAKIASNALLGAGYLWILKTPQKQGWHDSLAGTYVLKKYNGVVTGILSLAIVVGLGCWLAYGAFVHFRQNVGLQYDLATLLTQVGQDLNKIDGTTTPFPTF